MKKIQKFTIGFIKIIPVYLDSFLSALKMLWTENEVHYILSLTSSDSRNNMDIYQSKVDELIRELKETKPEGDRR